MTTENKQTLLASYYRPPISQGARVTVVDNFINKFETSMVTAITSNPDCLPIVGDFNDKCQSRDDDHSQSELGKKLFDTVTSLNLHQIITEPTRYTTNTVNLLDIIITDSPCLLSSTEVSPPIANLDHCVISCSLAFSHITD